MMEGELTMKRKDIQALETQLSAKDEHFVVREDLLSAVVCSDLSEDMVVARMKTRPCGTKSGWILATGKKAKPLQGSPCEVHSGYKHYIFEC